MLRVVVDLGNSRVKWGRLGPSGSLDASIALSTDGPAAWAEAWELWNPAGVKSSTWAVATVNPPAAERLDAFLQERGIRDARWYRSAADVPLRHTLERPETAGADRGCAVVAAVGIHPGGGPGLVVSCGTAITVDRIAADGTWQGGAIAPGLRLSARALHLLTAQLPEVDVSEAPPAWGPSTLPALAAGVFWGVVGSIRELLERQATDLSPSPWLLWTGGDSPTLAPWVVGDHAHIVPDLVLQGLAQVDHRCLDP